MMYKYVVICPYFGKLPNNFELWLEACSYNDKFKFIVITDDSREFKLPKNVEIKKESFEKFKLQIQSKFDFDISLDTPYKLCDYKVTYGYIFEEYLDNADYWGYCDLDLIFGNLSKFLPKEEYDKISHEGHFCLFRNTKEMREAFMLQGDSRINYKNILSSNTHFGFDEIGKYGINSILNKYGYKVYDYEKNVADINCKLESLNVTSGHGGKYKTLKGKRVFEFNHGSIFGYNLVNNEIEKTEYAYIHFQKRKMKLNLNQIDNSKFIISHHSFENYRHITKDLIKKFQPKIKISIRRFIKLKFRAIKIRIKRYIEFIKK